MNNKLKDLNLTMYKANNSLSPYIQSYWHVQNTSLESTYYPINGYD